MEKSKDLSSKSHSDEQSNNETEAISSTSLVDRSESDVNHTKLEIVDQEFQNLVLEEDRNPNRVERVGHLECKYHLTPGGCKFSKACRYHHPQEKIVVEPPQKVNFLDLPMRPGKRECPFYMRTGSCKFASNCRFHHPNPSAGGSDSSYDRSSSVPFHSSAPQSVGAPWSIPRPPIDAAPYARPYMPQMPVEEFPERPGQKECQSYMNTGNCKYKSACRFHHPKTRTPKSSNPSPFSLPIRPVEMTFGADEDGHNKNHALYHRDKEELLKKAREDDTMMSTREGDIVETQNQALETRNTTVTESVTPTEPQNQLVTEPVTPTQPQNQVVDTHGTVVVKTPAPTSVEMDTVGTTPSVTPTEPQNQAVETHDTAVAKTHPRLLWRLLGRWTTSVEMDTTGTTPSVTPTKPQNQAVETHDTAVAKTPAPTSVEMDTVGTTLSATPTEPQNQAVETHTQQTNDTTAHTEQARDGSQVQEHSHTAMLEESHVQEVLGTDLTQEGSSSPKPTRVTRKRATEGGDPRETYKVPKDGPFPGGPKDCSHLKTFYDHIALMIWFGKERPPLKPVHHTKSLIGWKINNMPSHFHSRLNATGLQVLSYSLSALNRSLISTFVERWHRETSSFHLPWGEMTITLDDVKQISGLNIEGEQLRNYEFGDHEQAAELVGRTLGLNREEVRAEFKANLNQYVVSFKWLKTKMKAVELYKDSSNPNPSEEDKKKVDCIVRGYLLYALGCTLFPTKSGSRVSVYYLKYLEDLEKVNKYAWGASGLGYLYSALSSASHHDTRQIDGFLSLLEIWIYEHFTILRGKIAAGYDESQPRVKRWSHCSGDTNKQGTLIELRQKIDKIALEEIIWDPYQDLRGGSRRLVAISFYEGLLTYLGAPGRAPYMPNRVLRQFGYVQGIPVEPTSLYGEYWTQWRNHVVDPTRRVSKKSGESGYLTSYMVWYMDNTHQKCQNPDRWVEYGAGFGSVTDTPADKQIVNDTFRYWFESGFGKLVDTVGRGKRHCGSTGYDVLKEAAQDFLKCSSLIMPAHEQVMEEGVEDVAKEREEEDDQKGNEFHIEMRRRSERKTKKRNVPAQSSVTIQDVVDLPPRHRFRSKRPNVVDQHKKKGKKVVK